MSVTMSQSQSDVLEFQKMATSPTESDLEGEIPAAGGSITSDTLDEPVFTTVQRDVKAIGAKFIHVLYPKQSQALLRDWDLWGPLFLCVLISLMLHSEDEDPKVSRGRGPQFTDVFMLTFFGASIVTLNIKLLGGTISFFQSVCVLGYCLLAPAASLIVCKIILLATSTNLITFIIRFLVTCFGFGWATFASTAFLGNSAAPRRKALAIYPIFLFYFVLSWLIISHTHYGH